MLRGGHDVWAPRAFEQGPMTCAAGMDYDRARRRPGAGLKRSVTAGGMQKLLITIGVILLAAGLLWPVLSKLGIGRLPGDIVIRREGFTFYFPITTMILISLALTLVVRFWGK